MKFFILILTLTPIFGCTQTLENNLTNQLDSKNFTDQITAYALLSTLALSDESITKISKNKDNFLNNFLLSKATLNPINTEKFINQAKENLDLITNNKTSIKKISSPFYDHMINVAYDSDAAIELLIMSAKHFDGANLEILSNDLKILNEINAERFSKVLNKQPEFELYITELLNEDS